MKFQGSHVSSFQAIRALAIQCHALDLSGGELLFASTHADRDERTRSIYQEQFTSLLLRLAIAIRTKFYQGYDDRSTISYVAHCGSLFRYVQAKEESVEFSMKDICDRIIEAVTFEKDLEGEIEKAPTTLSGRSPEGVEWELSVFVGLFAEAVLNWARDMETGQSDLYTAPASVSVIGADEHASRIFR